jgi:hypothetical protein
MRTPGNLNLTPLADRSHHDVPPGPVHSTIAKEADLQVFFRHVTNLGAHTDIPLLSIVRRPGPPEHSHLLSPPSSSTAEFAEPSEHAHPKVCFKMYRKFELADCKSFHES